MDAAEVDGDSGRPPPLAYGLLDVGMGRGRAIDSISTQKKY